MIGGLDLEQRYRRVLRLLPGYYRDKWEEDMVAAFLDSWLTGWPLGITARPGSSRRWPSSPAWPLCCKPSSAASGRHRSGRGPGGSCLALSRCWP